MKILYYMGWSLARVISRVVFRMRVTGQENIPKTGGFILATNHISYYDPPIVGSGFTRQVYFLAKKELFKNPIFGGIIRRTNALPVKRGGVDRQGLKMCVDVINDGHGLTIFPEGTRSKTNDFLPAKPGVGLLVKSVRCPIVPGYLHGSNKLSDCFWGRDRMSLTYGEPFPAEWSDQFEGKEGYMAIANAVMDRIREIRESVLEGRR